uniref:CAP-Gly domain-containing protein n=1 Tax=Dunaliella tertiolecta TaxID=3047 RepID=A0A7S3R9P1_DUNTE
MQALRNYVQGPSSQNRASSTVLLHVSHSNLKITKFFELRLDMHMTIEQLKVKLSFHVGTNASAQVLQLKDDSGRVIAPFMEDHHKLGYYSPHDGFSIHIIDTDPNSASANGWLEDTDLVDKYKMSDEDYNKRENTYRKFKEAKLKEDPTWTLEKEMAKKRGQPIPQQKEKQTDPDFLAAEASSCTVGSRASVEPGDRRCEVMFVGRDVAGLPLGWWVGVKYDEPLGKSDGAAGGQRYFQCSPGYGGFVRPDKVKVGDYPPIDDGLSDGLSEGDEI